MTRRPLGGAFVYAVAAVAAGVAGLIFHALMSRALGPSEYGTFAALLNVLLVAAVPLAGIELAVAATVSKSEKQSNRIAFGELVFRSLLLGASVVVISAGASPALAEFLHMRSPDPVVLAGVYLGLATMAAPMRGMVLGEIRYRRLAVATLLAGAIKLVLGSILLLGGGSLAIAMAILVVAELGQLIALVWGSERSWEVTGATAGFSFRSAAVPTLAIAGVWLLGTGDVIAARNVFAGGADGIYAAAGTAAHMLLFIPQIIFQTSFPLLVRSEGDGLRRRFWSATAIALGLSGLAGAVVLMMPGTVTKIMFGSEFLSAVPLTRILVPATLAVGFVYGVVHLHQAARKRLGLVGWLGVGGVGAVILIDPATPREFAAWVLVVSIASAAFALVGARRAWESGGTYEIDLTSPPTCDLTVVVPFFNPSDQVVDTISAILGSFADRQVEVEIVAVSDGSTDGSAELVARLAATDRRVRLITLPFNQGKGAALRAGMARAKGEWIGFLDADGDIPPSALRRYLDLARLYHPDAVIGCKRHRLSHVVGYPPLRRLVSIGYASLTRLLFRLGIGDTQTGAKIFSRDALGAALPNTVESGFAFDLELLVAIRAAGHTQIAEAPVSINQGLSSTVSIRAAAEAIFATARIAARAVAAGPADTSGSPVEQVSRSHSPVIVGG